MAIVFLLGFVLVWQGLFAVSAAGRSVPGASSGSCCGPACAKCPTPPCCASPSQPSSPSTPAPARASNQNEALALALPPAGKLALYSPASSELTFRVRPSVPVAAVPLFQRDCCYQI